MKGPCVLTVILSGIAMAAEPADAPRQSHPFAPSLPLLSDADEARNDRVIDRFMLYDTGKLKGVEGKTALRDFENLGPESIPALIRGLNRAAKIEHSCPCLVIAKKLQRMLLASRDTELLEFARDEIGSGVGRTRHQPILQDLRVILMMRKNALARPGFAPPRRVRSMTTAELVAGVTKEQGPRLKEILTALEQRTEPEALRGLALAAAVADKEMQELARDLLDKHLYRRPVAELRKRLRDDSAEVRRAAIRLIAARYPALASDLIDLLDDAQPEVRKAAHQALVLFNKGEDLGPAVDADASTRQAAIKKWRAWWEQRTSP